MGSFCLPKHLATDFKSKLKNGEITPEKLMAMTSAERRTFFAEFMGEVNAKETNAAFESKLILKNQQQGIINWAKSVAGIKPEVKRDLISRVEKMTEVLQPAQMDSFLADLAEKKLGIGVTAEEAKTIAELSKNIQDTRATMEASTRRLPGQPATEEEFAHGMAKVKFYEYVNDLKVRSEKRTFMEKLKNPVDTAIELGGGAKSIKASMDNSAIFRQGWKTLMTHPTIWLPNAANTFRNMAKTIGGKDVMNAVNADIVSRPTYDLMQKARLAVGTVEEAYPAAWPEKIPALGRLYKASENAFTAFVHKTRADVFDYYLNLANKSGIDTTEKDQLESIGKLVNSLTGRGNLNFFGRLNFEPAANVLNNVFFSPRWVKSQLDTLTLHATDKGFSWWARKQAALNLLKMILGTSAVLTIANAVMPGSVETDSRSSDFGKIKVGNTRFDVTGGLGGMVTLFSRLIQNSSKSSITGMVTPLGGDEFGAKTRGDVLLDFFTNKLSPAASLMKDLFTGKTFEGTPPTIASELENLFVPLPISNYFNVKDDPEAANSLLIMIADGLGISANTYSKEKSEAEILYEELSKLPKDEAQAKTDALKTDNPDLYEDLKKVFKDEQLGITEKDKYIRDLGVANGERAQYIYDEAMTLPNDDERRAYLQDLKDKGIATKDVIEQLKIYKEENADELIDKAKDADDPDTMAGLVKLYMKAFGADPWSAIETLFTHEQLKDVRGGAVIMERMGIDESQAIKKKGGASETDKLDHTVPLELGGDNSESNLKIVTEEEWKSYTPVENFLGRLLDDGEITEKEAGETIKAFKNGEMTADEVYSKYQ